MANPSRVTARPTAMRPAAPRHYQIAIICALAFEARAVRALFDHHWDDGDTFPYNKAPGDSNAYSVGAIGRHNVVLAWMPSMGKASAAIVATSCRSTFPNIKLALVVGICGAVPFTPSGEEIVLGDVIISDGIIQYDFGRRFPERFVRKDTLLDTPGRPNAEIRAMLAKLKGMDPPSRLQEKVAEYTKSLQHKSQLGAKYPGSDCDFLFEPTYRHRADGLTCQEGPCNGPLVHRDKLEQYVLQPTVHFGLVASGDTVMKAGDKRDAIAKETKVIAFEMEGVGVWDVFPCVVIKGACDYADSHKTKVWQRYAAATAAAGMKAFLEHWTPAGPGPEDQELDKKKSELLVDLNPFGYNEYQLQKDRNPERVAGTCEWFINHRRFRRWQMRQGSAFLWVSADPGCGKSVLVKYLVDEILPSTKDRTTCYFFFKDDNQGQKEVTNALRCILLQLFQQQPALLSDNILTDFENNKKKLDRFPDLWDTLIEATSHENMGEVICLLDALDECEEKGRLDLHQALDKLYRSGSPPKSLKFLATSRPYEKIRSKFENIVDRQPFIHLSGESAEEVDEISEEINLVIQARLDKLRLSKTVRRELRTKMTKFKNRTYLWVYLVFNDLEKDVSALKRADVISHVEKLPATVEAAYDKILSRSQLDEKIKTLLQIIISAKRALSLKEMALALAIDAENHQTHGELEGDVLSPEQLSQNIREICGGFVVVRDLRVYLLHQTAREFLVRRQSLSTPKSGSWQYSICPRSSNTILSDICIDYLLLSDFSKKHHFETDRQRSEREAYHAYAAKTGDFSREPRFRWLDQRNEQYPFLTYAAANWVDHVRHADSSDHMVSSAMRLCDPSSQTCSTWFNIYEDSMEFALRRDYAGYLLNLKGSDTLIIASILGLEEVVESLLKKGAKITSQDFRFKRSALSWASERGNEYVVKLLLNQISTFKALIKQDGVVDGEDSIGRTPLWFAARAGHVGIAEALIKKGARIDCKRSNFTPLAIAALRGHEDMVKMLLRKGANIEGRGSWPPLTAAAAWGQLAMVKLLLEKGANIEGDGEYTRPITQAHKEGNWAIVRLLLKKGANGAGIEGSEEEQSDFDD